MLFVLVHTMFLICLSSALSCIVLCFEVRCVLLCSLSCICVVCCVVQILWVLREKSGAGPISAIPVVEVISVLTPAAEFKHRQRGRYQTKSPDTGRTPGVVPNHRGRFGHACPD